MSSLGSARSVTSTAPDTESSGSASTADSRRWALKDTDEPGDHGEYLWDDLVQVELDGYGVPGPFHKDVSCGSIRCMRTTPMPYGAPVQLYSAHVWPRAGCPSAWAATITW